MKKIYLITQLTLLVFLVKGQSYCNPVTFSQISVSSTSACPNGVITAYATGGSIPATAYYKWEAMNSSGASTFSGGLDFGQQGSPVNVVNNAQFTMPTASWPTTYYIRLKAVCANGNLNIVGSEIAVTKAGPPTVATLTTQVAFCAGTSASIAVTSTAGATYSWTKDGVALAGATTQTINFASPTATNAGVYKCLITNACGTATSSAITFTTLGSQTIPGSASTATNSTKVYSVVNQSNSGVSYLWTISGGGTITSATNTNSVSVDWANTIGTYTLSLTKTLGACQVTDTKTVEVVACTTNTILVETNGNNGSNQICESSNVAIGLFSSGTFTWTANTPGAQIYSPNSQFTTVTATTSTTFSLSHIDAPGCARTGTIEITVNPKPQFSITATSASVCANQSSTLSVTGSNVVTYDWNSSPTIGANSPSVVNPSVTTTYTANAYNGSTACKSTQTIVIVVVPNPAINIAVSNPNICAGQSSTLTAGGGATSYTWSENNATTNSIVVSPSATTIYTLNGANSIGCVGVTQMAVNVNSCTGINELDNSVFVVYPNPAKNFVTVETTNALHYEIYNSIGEKVAIGTINEKQNQIDISNLSKGVYIIQLNDGKTKGVKRIIKE